MKGKLKVGGYFTVECFDKNGRLKWRQRAKNGVVNQGLDYALDIIFGTETPPTWYVGLIRDDNYSGLSAADTMSSHSGWEEGDEYSESTRQEITMGAASSQEVSNSERCYFSVNATETMKGVFICDNSTKSGSSGKLFCTALFDGGDESVVNGDVLKVVYTVAAAAV